MKRIVATLVVVLLITVLFSGCLGSGEIQSFSASSLKAPTMEDANTSSTQLPQNITTVFTEFKGYSIRYSLTEVYADYGGILILEVQNDQATQIFVYGFGLHWIDSNLKYIANCGVYINPGQSKQVGLMAFGAPSVSGFHEYEVVIKVLAKSQTSQNWNDYGESSPSSKYANVIKRSGAENYTSNSNERGVYNMINSRVDFSLVSGIATDIQAKYPGGYSVLQIVQAYQWVHDNIEYKTDENGDYWQKVQETLDLGTGDCEDQAILLASIITALGGSTRVNLIEEHAFPTVYVGSSQAKVDSTNQAIRSYYGAGNQMHICYLHDSLGYWLVVDTTGFPYAGGLPAKAVAMSGTSLDAWTFEGTSYLITIDVTGQQAGSGLFGI